MTNNLPAELKDYWVQNEIIMPVNVNSWAGAINQLSDAIPLYAHTGNFYTATYSNNVYNLTPLSFQDSTSNVPLSSYTEGMTVSFICPANNSASCQVKVGSLNAVPIKDIQNNNITAGFFKTGFLITLVYNSANQYFKVFNQAVQKTGDTMTGGLIISANSPYQGLRMNDTGQVAGTTPSSERNIGLRFYDSNNTYVGYIQNTYGTDGSRNLLLNCRNGAGNTSATIRVGFDGNNDASCEFPKTKCVDGQWVDSHHVLSTSKAIGNYQIDISSYLPSDRTSYDYEVMIAFGGGRSGGGSNSFVSISDTAVSLTAGTQIATNPVYGFTEFDGDHGEAGQISCIVIARKNNDKFYFNISNAAIAEGCLIMTKYRRIGTNA